MKLLATSVRGDGDTAVLLLHGIGGGRSIWDDAGSGTTRALAAAGYRAVAADLPGYGDSQRFDAPDLDVMVDAVRELIASLAAVRLVLLGHSMGGMIAQELMARDPGPVQGLVLACTSASFGKADGAWQALFLAERLAPLDAGLGMSGLADKLAPGLVSPQAPPEAVRAARQVMACVPEATYRAALQAIAGFDRREALSALRVPTLLLAAEHDRAAPADVMQRMAVRIVGSEYACIPQAGHIANVEAPAAFNAAVLAFLSRHFPPQA